MKLAFGSHDRRSRAMMMTRGSAPQPPGNARSVVLSLIIARKRFSYAA